MTDQSEMSPITSAARDAALRALGDYTGADPERPWWNLNMPKALDIMLPAIREAIAADVREAARDNVTWLREHKQNHDDLIRIVATEDAYRDALRTIEGSSS